MRRNLGFTLIEMVVVLAVVAILAAILVPTIAKNINDAKNARAVNECNVIGAAIASFYKDAGVWPTAARAGGVPATLLVGVGANLAAANNWGTAVAINAGSLTATQLFDDHLINNEGSRYPTAYNLELRWKGPYLTEVKPDPWGRRYSCNVGNLGGTAAVFVISAGVNGTFETAVPGTATSLSGDDCGLRIQ